MARIFRSIFKNLFFFGKRVLFFAKDPESDLGKSGLKKGQKPSGKEIEGVKEKIAKDYGQNITIEKTPVLEKILRIKIILPTFYDENHKLIKSRKAIVPNLSILYLAGLLPRQHAVSILEERVSDIDFDEPVDLVAVSVNTPNVDRAYEIAAEFRKRNIKVVMGGIHVTCLPDEASRHCDAVVIGEAEDSWPQLVRDFANNEMKKIYRGQRRESLDNLPHPRFDLLDASKYAHLPFNKSTFIPIQTSRGCPHNCDFCSVTKFWGSTMRYRPIKDIIEEIKLSKSKLFFFTDDNFFSNQERAAELCKALVPLKIKYFCQIDTLAYMKPDLVKLLARSGCMLAYIGIESLNKDNLKGLKKGFNKPEEYQNLFKVFNKNGVGIFASIMFGLDNDTPQAVEDTVKFLIRNKASVGAFFPLTPFPGTALYDRLKAANRLIDDEWWLKADYLSHHVRIKYDNKENSGAELRRLAAKLFYTGPSITKRFFPIRRNSLFPLLINLIMRRSIKKSGFSLA